MHTAKFTKAPPEVRALPGTKTAEYQKPAENRLLTSAATTDAPATAEEPKPAETTGQGS